ncbi:BCS1-like ATPase [Apiospora arundinis]
MKLYTFGTDARALMPMLHHMQAMYAEKMAGKHLEVYMTEIVDKGRLVWKKTSQRPRPRRLDTINMDDNVVDIVLNDIKAFLLEKNFYLRKGVPHRRGHLYHGAPGCGKSTLAQLVAGVFGLAIHTISLKTLHGSQEAIAELFGDMKKPGILLLEDIDTAGLANRDLDLGLDLSMMINDEINNSGLASMAPKEPSKAESVEPPSLDVVLNVLDGVSSDEGRVVLMTTNRLDALDEALIRPGRIDLTIHCPLASAKVAQDMFYRFFGPDDESTAANSFEKKGNITKEQQAKIAHNDDGSSTTSSSRTKKPPSPPTTPALPRPQVQLERSEALELAKRFGEIMGGVLLSPAAIQGYCLQIRQDPVGGVEKASEWKEKTLGEAKERQLKKQTKG